MTDFCKRKYKIIEFGRKSELPPNFGILWGKDIDNSRYLFIHLGWKTLACRKNSNGEVTRGIEHDGNLSPVGKERRKLFKQAQKQICK